MRQIKDILRETRRLDDTPNLDGALVLNQRADRIQQLGAELRVPAVLPRDEADDAGDHFAGILVLFHVAENTGEGFGGEADGEAGAVGFDGFGLVVQALGEGPENFPFFGGFLVLHGLGAVLCHLGAPDCVDAEVFVEDHEEAVEPAFAEAFVVEAGELLFCCFGLWNVSR